MEKRVWFGRNRKCGACRDADGVGLVGYKDADGVCPSKCYRILAQPRGKVARYWWWLRGGGVWLCVVGRGADAVPAAPGRWGSWFLVQGFP